MDFNDRKSLIREGDQRLAQSGSSHKKLVLIYAGVVAAALLLVAVVNYFLQEQISGTGGLSGIGKRSILETIVTVLQFGTTVASPFWTMGYVFCILGIVRGTQTQPRDLLTGFRRFGPLLRLNLYRIFKYLLIAMLCVYPSVFLYLLTPLAEPAMAILEPLTQVATTPEQVAELMDDATMNALANAMTPWIWVYLLVFAALAAPTFYRLRMADYLLLDNPTMGALAAVRGSTMLTARKRMALLKLDLRFWWYYLAMLASVAVSYAPVGFTAAGIPLPEWAGLGFYALCLVMQFGITVLWRNRLEAAFAAAYLSLNQPFDALDAMIQAL